MTDNQQYAVVKELSSGTICKRTDGILIIRQPVGKDNASMTELKEQYDAFMEIQQGERSPLMVVVYQLKKLENEQKMFLMSTMPSFASKVGVVTRNPIVVFMFNVLFFLTRPAVPSRVFSNEEEALTWLKA